MQCGSEIVEMRVTSENADMSKTKSWKFLSFFVFFFLSLQRVSSTQDCPSGWQSYMNYCYQLRGLTSFSAKVWTSARLECYYGRFLSRRHASLASIHSSGEQAFVMNLIHQTTNISNVQSIYIGLSSHTSGGGYAWSDETPVSYTHWRPGFISDHGKQCVVISTADGYWRDQNCDETSAYICRKRKASSANLPTQAPPMKVNTYCQSGWDQYGDRCYWYSDYTQATYATAEWNCKARSAELVSINSIYEQAYVLAKQHGRRNMWLGLNDKATEGEYVWTDGSNVSFTEWGFGEPNSRADHEDCVELVARTGLWNDRTCSGTLSYVCEKAATYTTAPATPATNCLTGWLLYNGHCYWFDTNAMLNYTDAESFCASHHAHLVHINDLYENAYIVSQYPIVGGKPIISNRSTHLWIGLSDGKTEGLYTWTDGYPVEFTSWEQREPNNYNYKEDCVELYVRPSSHLISGVWNDLYCEQKLGLVCERQATNAPSTLAPQPTTSAHGKCPSGFVDFKNYCYKFDYRLRVNWIQALHRCLRYGTSLVSIHSADEQKFVVDQAKKAGFHNSMWIGLSDRNVEGGFVWSDSSPVQYVNWAANEPNDYFSQEDCVELYLSSSNKWNDNSCGRLSHFACKIRAGKPLLMPAATIAPYYGHACPPHKNTFSHGRYCYTFVATKMTWSDASKACQKSYSNGHLVSITNLDEQEFITNSMKTINDSDIIAQSWIGLHDREAEGSFQWIDKSPVNFIYWHQGEPNNQGASEDCVELMDAIDWNDQTCSESLPYVCKYPRPGTTIPTPRNNVNKIWGSCPQNWTATDSFCYLLHKRYKTWLNAEKTCIKSGGHLTSIQSAAESTFLIKQLPKDIRYIWIGLNDRENEHTFKWTDGSPVLLISWSTNEPSDFDGQQNCVYINKQQSRWSDISCGRKFPFVCKRPKIPYPSTAPPSVPPAYKATCDMTYNQCFGKSKGCQRVTCSGDCQQSSGNIYGWQIYSGDSSVCRAAIQLGLITVNDITTVLDVKRMPGRTLYSSANENGVFSLSHGHTNTSFTFRLPSNRFCDRGWVFHDHACYQFVTSSATSSKSWSAARQACRSNGAYLTAVQNSQEQAFLQSQLPPVVGKVWIGLNDLQEHGSFVWTDGTPVQFTVWGTGQPSHVHGSESCVLMNLDNGHQSGTWTTANCETNAGYICEKFVEPSLTDFPLLQGDCLDDWVMLGTNCYWVIEPDCVSSHCEMSWDKARAACQMRARGADLTSINTFSELQQARYVLPMLGWGHVWIGLNDKAIEGVYEWSDGSSVGERGLNWAPGEPNDKNRTQNCVAMLQDGTMTDQDCSLRYPYACEIPLAARSSTKLTKGAVAGLVLGLLLFIVVTALVVIVIIRRRRRGSTSSRYNVMNKAVDDDDSDGGLLGDITDETGDDDPVDL